MLSIRICINVLLRGTFGDIVGPVAGADLLIEEEAVFAAELVREAGDAFAETLKKRKKIVLVSEVIVFQYFLTNSFLNINYMFILYSS
jgi:hypothetical protein